MVGQQSLDLLIGVRIPVSQPAFMSGWHDTEVRVRYAETDQMGIAHHANYLIWFETGRSDLCRARGFSYKDMEERENALLVVAESYVRYKSPAFYEDILTVRTGISEIRSRSIRFNYEIHRATDEMMIAEGETLHLVTGRDQKVRSIPEVYKRLLAGDDPLLVPADQALR
jgi:acyl-CoA thioester hydrolase